MMKTNLKFLSLLLFLSTTSVRCQMSSSLEYGNPINLKSIDWEKIDVSQFLSKVNYSKRITLVKTDEVYTGSKPLKLQDHFVHNVDSDSNFISNQTDEEESFTIIEPNEKNWIPESILWATLLVSNENLMKKGGFGYYQNKSLLFNNIMIVTTEKNRMAKVMLYADSLSDKPIRDNSYRQLRDILDEEYKGAEFEVGPPREGEPSYKWRTKDRLIKTTCLYGTQTLKGKFQHSRTIILEILYVNSETKDILPESY